LIRKLFGKRECSPHHPGRPGDHPDRNAHKGRAPIWWSGSSREKPSVCVELCKPRYEAIRQRDKWQQTDIVKVIREKRTSILLSQLIMASFQRKIAQKFNITPGEEMLRAIARAEEIGAEIVLADREIRVTLLRTWRKMGFWSKMKVLPSLLSQPRKSPRRRSKNSNSTTFWNWRCRRSARNCPD
jgi:pheromone shutdown protein TraB